MVKEVIDVLNARFVDKFGDRLFYNVVFPTMDDKKAEADRLGILVEKGILTPDEARQELGYAPKGGEADELPITTAERIARMNTAKNIIRSRGVLQGALNCLLYTSPSPRD